MSDFPEWADRWLDGRCGCGARLVVVTCQMSDEHIVCSASGWDTEVCPKAEA